MRLFFVGGWMSYRALFGWLTPWILIPTFVLDPVVQIVFFVSIGRAAGVQDDTFFLIGNAVVAAAIPCLFATGAAVEGERWSQTLGLLLVSPARRVPLFLGRAFPAILNGFLVALFALAAGAIVVGVSIPVQTWLPITAVLAVSAYSVTGLGLVTAAVALRVRDSAVMSNVVLGVLLLFSAVNVPLNVLPDWMSAISPWLPLTHGIEAARALAAEQPASGVVAPALNELAIGSAYLFVGIVLIVLLEQESRRSAALERS